MTVRAGRGEAIGEDEIAAVREWWHVDGFGVVQLVMPAVEHYGHSGDLARALDIAEDAVAQLERTWGRFHAVVRLAALVAGQVATRRADARRAPCSAAPTPTSSRMTAKVDAIVAEPQRGVREPTHRGDRGDQHRDLGVGPAAAGRAAAAAVARPAAASRPTAEAMVDAWQESVEAFERYGHVYETARSRARLAAALRAAGDAAGARREADLAREVAIRLGAAPLLRRARRPRSAPTPATAGSPDALTPREQEVLELVARGLSNGQVGQQLFISTKTASVHVSRILAKLGAASRTEAAAIARDRGLVP